MWLIVIMIESCTLIRGKNRILSSCRFAYPVVTKMYRDDIIATLLGRTCR